MVSTLCHGTEWIENQIHGKWFFFQSSQGSRRDFQSIYMVCSRNGFLFCATEKNGSRNTIGLFLPSSCWCRKSYRVKYRRYRASDDKMTMVRKGTKMMLGDSPRPKRSKIKHRNTVRYPIWTRESLKASWLILTFSQNYRNFLRNSYTNSSTSFV